MMTVAGGSARFSKSLERRRLRPNLEKVRSTTQRRGRKRSPSCRRSADDLHVQQRRPCHGSVNLPGVAAAIGPDQFEPREAVTNFIQDQASSVAVLDRGGVDNDPHRQPFVSTGAGKLCGKL
jgi:hypothetical protein